MNRFAFENNMEDEGDSLYIETPRKRTTRKQKKTTKLTKKDKQMLKKWQKQIVELNKKINEKIKNSKKCQRVPLSKTLEYAKKHGVNMRTRKNRKNRKNQKVDGMSNELATGPATEYATESATVLEPETVSIPNVKAELPITGSPAAESTTTLGESATETKSESVPESKPSSQPEQKESPGVLSSITEGFSAAAESVGLSNSENKGEEKKGGRSRKRSKK